jgi:hypothetical protein
MPSERRHKNIHLSPSEITKPRAHSGDKHSRHGIASEAGVKALASANVSIRAVWAPARLSTNVARLRVAIHARVAGPLAIKLYMLSGGARHDGEPGWGSLPLSAGADAGVVVSWRAVSTRV